MTKQKNLLPAERQRLIFEYVLQSHTITVKELAEKLNVSEMTIRRDLAALEKEEKVESVYGGVVSMSINPFELSFAQREMVNVNEKRMIGYAAAQLVEDDDMIALDGSSTTLQVARSLSSRDGLRIVTNGLKAAIELGHRSGISIILTGGELYKSTSLVGPFARASIEKLHVNKLFFSVTGITEDMGLSGPSEQDAEIKEALIKMAETTILVADSSKFGRKSYVKVAPISAIDVVVSDAGLSQTYIRFLEDQGVRVIIAKNVKDIYENLSGIE